MKTKQTNKLITLLTQKEFKELRSNFDINNERSAQGENVKVFEPVVKFFNPTGLGTWYLTELSPNNMGFGICELQEIELGYVSLNALNELRLPLGLSIEKDRTFSAKGQTIYQLLETLQTGENIPDEKQNQERFEKKLTSLRNHIFIHQTDLVELCLEEGLIPFEYIRNSHNLFDRNGNKLSEDEAKKAEQKDDSHALYYSKERTIYTWFLVTDWLAKKLEAKYETILVCSIGTWWGRTTDNQPVVEDQVIREIAEEYL